jgi:DNA repair photolyase
MSDVHLPHHRGRGAVSNTPSSYLERTVDLDAEVRESPATRVHLEQARTIISRNRSADVPFDQSINPYRGCEHGCVYCFARPSHTRLGLSAGLDFETEIYAKPRAAELLRDAFERPQYRPSVIHLGSNTDPYQPVEQRLRLTRALLECFLEYGHPVTVLTKSALVLRDLDLLTELARRRLVRVALSVTTLDDDLKRILEPRASAGAARLRAIGALRAAGVPTAVMVAPVIPYLTDGEMETILTAARRAGAERAGWILLRLPLEVQALFTEWLNVHRPGAARRVLARLGDSHGGRLYDSRFHHRKTGSGPYAGLLARRFDVAKRRLGYATTEPEPLDVTRFRPKHVFRQPTLF